MQNPGENGGVREREKESELGTALKVQYVTIIGNLQTILLNEVYSRKSFRVKKNKNIMHTHTRVRAHTYTHTRTYIYIYIYIYSTSKILSMSNMYTNYLVY